MNKIDERYLDILDDIITYGYDYADPNREGVFRKELETVIVNHLVNDGYPIVSIRKTFFKGAVGELLLFLKGSTDIRDYINYKINFWTPDWARFKGYSESEYKAVLSTFGDISGNDSVFDMGKIYGHQYKKQYNVFDNFKQNLLRTDLVVNAWQVDDLKEMCLIPCHFAFQILGSTDGFKICWFQRSTDFMLGSPINIQYYYLMGLLLEAWSGHKFLGVTGILNKCHLYSNQIDLALKMIESERETSVPKVTITIDDKFKNLSFEEFIKNIEPSNFVLENYTYVLDETVEMLTYKK